MRGKLSISTVQRRRAGLQTFNEARALCAGNFPRLSYDISIARNPFNEARALCAGNLRPWRVNKPRRPPSMRPALYARETVTRQEVAVPTLQFTFNEGPSRETCARGRMSGQRAALQ